MEEVLARHKKEQRDLQGKITQKKKAATKKTRKGVNDECAALEAKLKEQQAHELAALQGDSVADDAEQQVVDEEQTQVQAEGSKKSSEDIESSVQKLAISDSEKPTTNDTQPKKRNRQKDRLARRAAEQAALTEQAAAEAASMPDMKAREQEQMRSHFPKFKLEEKEIRPDGHCLFSAVADQLTTAGRSITLKETAENQKLPEYRVVRNVATDYISTNSDDFVPYLEEPLDEYIPKMRDTGEWGGHIELLALAKAYDIQINVLHADGRVDKIESGNSNGDVDQAIWLGYYRHSSGLGEHYNSLRKVS